MHWAVLLGGITSLFTHSPRFWWGLYTGAEGLQSDLESLGTLAGFRRSGTISVYQRSQFFK